MNNTPTLLADVPLGTIGGPGPGLGPWADITGIDAVVNFFNKAWINIFGIMTIAGGLWFIMQFIWGAYDYLYAGAEKERVEKAKRRLQNAITGLVILVAAYAIISLLGRILGLEILNPGQIIRNLRP